MLGISPYNVKQKIVLENYKTYKVLNAKGNYTKIRTTLLVVVIIFLLFMFLPWTQNVRGKGNVTTLTPDQRPQTIHTIISGRIEKWYVNEGDFVNKGDTILFISEIKDDYLDPSLIQNTFSQMQAKRLSAESYSQKSNSYVAQMNALRSEQKLKLEQAQNKVLQAQLKVRSDSMDLEAVRTQLNIAQTQYSRSLQLNNEGLKPVTDLEDKRLKLQDAEAKIITQENRYLASKNELINSRVEIGRLIAEFNEKLSKADSDRLGAISSQFDLEAQASKLENMYNNYKIRNELYYILAPQTGYVNRALQSGIGETIKEGTAVVSIMPANYGIAVETFVDPIDLPLMHRGEKIRIWFDGWPAIVFSGWPNMSYGTYGGKIFAIENFISQNGKYRVLIEPDPDDHPWPKELGIGAGANTFALLNNVPIWFEIWRNLNGFPPDYYQPNNNQTKK